MKIMSEEKLDLILTVVSELKGKVDKLDSRMDDLESGFNDFKKQVIKSFEAINKRIDILEKQMMSIGAELKEDLRRETFAIQEDISRLEDKIILEQAEKLQYLVRVRQLELRVAKLEETIRLAA
jgi:predicted  nucleic acid-binding Zn-ribbon protein